MDDRQPIFGRQSVLLPNFFVAENIVHYLPNFVAMWNPHLKARTHLSNFPLADSRGFKILNMFDRASQQTIIESAVESADSAVKSADSMANSSADSVKIGLWVRALKPFLFQKSNRVLLCLISLYELKSFMLTSVPNTKSICHLYTKGFPEACPII